MERWTFGGFVLDLDARQLLRDGSAVALSPKALQLLGVLVQRHGTALSKTELQDLLWPGTFVVEKNLTNLVSEIREALGDDPAHPRFIRTVHRFGYAFRETPAADAAGASAAGANAPPGTRASDASPHNLPVPLTTFIGREREIAELLPLVTSRRLLTLTGAGGCGKTRLALEAAARLIDRFADGVWLADLSSLSDPGLVPQAIASTLDVREGPGRPVLDALVDFVRGREILLILDNCEHVIDACAIVADALLRTAERVRILATSREALGLTGESIWRVPSMSLPDPAETASPDSLARHDAVRLFVDRATAVDSAFTITTGTAATVAQVCIRLDGIPLAIELAAARARVLSIDQIHARLNDRFRLLTGGNRTAVARQRTLEATVDWSYSLLSEAERRLLQRLSVFAGGWTIEAAEDVAAGDGIEHGDVLDLLSRLVDKSLANVEHDADEHRRYSLLETVRQYARERLVESGEAGRLRDRHAAFFHGMLHPAVHELIGPAQLSWLNRLQREHDNLRLALEWCLTEAERREMGVELAADLFWFWVKRGYFREGQHWLERAMSVSEATPPALHASAIMTLGFLTFFMGDLARTQSLLAESSALATAAGDLPTVAFSIGISALAAFEQGDRAGCLRLAAESETAAAAAGLPWLRGPAVSCRAYVALTDGDLDLAGRLHEETLELSRQQGDEWSIGIVLYDLAFLRLVQHRHDEARALAAEGIALNQQFGDRRGIAWCLGILSAADAADGDALGAARLRGAMEGLLESVGAPIQASYNEWIGDRSLEAMKASLGITGFEAAIAEGRALPLARAIQLGLK